MGRDWLPHCCRLSCRPVLARLGRLPGEWWLACSEPATLPPWLVELLLLPRSRLLPPCMAAAAARCSACSREIACERSSGAALAARLLRLQRVEPAADEAAADAAATAASRCAPDGMVCCCARCSALSRAGPCNRESDCRPPACCAAGTALEAPAAEPTDRPELRYSTAIRSARSSSVRVGSGTTPGLLDSCPPPLLLLLRRS